MTIHLVACAASISLLAGAAVGEEILYENNFQNGPLGSEWSGSSERVWESNFTWFNGRHTNQRSILTLEAVQLGGTWDDTNDDGEADWNDGDGDGGDGDDGGGPRRVVYTLEFDFYAIDSWDGNDRNFGPDTFQVLLGGREIFAETFSNNHGNQSFREPDRGREHLGFSPAWKDSIYRDITVQFELPEESATFTLGFRGIGLQSVYDESWGIDNVKVGFEIIPAPAGLSAMAGMFLLAGRRRGR